MFLILVTHLKGPLPSCVFYVCGRFEKKEKSSLFDVCHSRAMISPQSEYKCLGALRIIKCSISGVLLISRARVNQEYSFHVLKRYPGTRSREGP